ncbi:hypothetical protein Q5752_006470 [Cryptotrichosporon argae]
MTTVQTHPCPPPSSCTIGRPASTRGTFFESAYIFDLTGPDPYVGDVLVDGKCFAQVGGHVEESRQPPHDVLVVDAEGRQDAHERPITWNDAPTLDGLCDLAVEEHTIHTVVSAKMYLDHGYTMCIGAASAKQRLEIAVRDSAHPGKIPSSRFLANGSQISVTGGAIVPGIANFADDPDKMRKLVRENISLGVNNIKLSMTGTSAELSRSTQGGRARTATRPPVAPLAQS